jgi:hypothetical protein
VVKWPLLFDIGSGEATRGFPSRDCGAPIENPAGVQDISPG